MNARLRVQPAFYGMPYPPQGFGHVNETEATRLSLLGTTCGLWTLNDFFRFEDFVWEFPYRGERRTGARDADFGFKAAEHAVRRHAGGTFIDEFDAEDRF